MPNDTTPLPAKALPLHGTGDLRLSIITSPELPTGHLANTVATIAAGLGAAHPGIGNVPLPDANGLTILNSADRPIPILQAGAAQMLEIIQKAQAHRPDLTLVAFPEFARKLHSFADYEAAFPQRALATEPLSGVGLCGPTKLVKSLTGALKLLR
ncbi:DUF2000 domain-containing protein [Shimia sp.]|uniref:DUF2000 domain-containing protein n=1 Tax=Shimia sp. TaxID=1954381 RepID=UPI003BAAFF68